MSIKVMSNREELRTATRRLGRAIVAAVAAATAAGSADAQTLAAKRALAPTSTLPCAATPAASGARQDTPEVRRLVALGHEAAIVGDHRQARDVFAEAARLSPGDERIAYQLGRAHEELRETQPAIREYCRFLSLTPQGPDAADARSRILALASAAGATSSTAQGTTSFRLGLAHLDQRRWREAADAFGRVIQVFPRAPEAYFNRALALSAVDERTGAVRDFEQYLALQPVAQDQALVRARVDALRRPSWSTSTALVTGLVLPGLGQVYTSRPWIGVGVAALAGTSLYLSFRPKDRQEIYEYSLPPGFPEPTYLDTVTVTKHPYYVAGLAVFGTLTIGAALEAANYARKSRGGGGTVGGRAPVARAGAFQLFAPALSPTAHGLSVSIAGRASIP